MFIILSEVSRLRKKTFYGGCVFFVVGREIAC